MVEVSWYVFLLVPLVLTSLVYFISLFLIERPPPLPLPGKHAFITGGSSGVGLSTAVLLVKLGIHCTILAREPKRLREAEERIKAAAKGKAKVLAITCDITDLSSCQSAIQKAQSEVGFISIFIHAAGAASPGYFEELPPSTHLQQFNLHYLGAVNCLHSLVPSFKQQSSCRIILVGSMGSLSAIFGYTAYSASKFALRALAEALQMELAPYGTFVSLVCPPDLDTPGFATENKIKPIECALISEGSGLFSPDVIGENIVEVLKNWRSLSSVGFDGKALTLLAAGTSPASSALTLTVEFFTMGVLRLVSVVYKKSYIGIVEKVKRRREKGEIRAIGKRD